MNPKIAVIALLLASLAGGWYVRRDGGVPTADIGLAAGLHRDADRDPVQTAFNNKVSGRVITIHGTVERVLSDDRDGSPHQRFIIRTPGGLTVLIAHNLVLAPRLEGLRPGERVSIKGEYEWNEKGGLMHWTHDDPQGQHETGYIEWRGRRYE